MKSWLLFYQSWPNVTLHIWGNKRSEQFSIMTLGVELMKNDSVTCCFLKIFSAIVWHQGQFTQCCFKQMYLCNGFNALVFIKTWLETANLLLENDRPTSHLKILPRVCCRVTYWNYLMGESLKAYVRKYF